MSIRWELQFKYEFETPKFKLIIPDFSFHPPVPPTYESLPLAKRCSLCASFTGNDNDNTYACPHCNVSFLNHGIETSNKLLLCHKCGTRYIDIHETDHQKICDTFINNRYIMRHGRLEYFYT